MRSWTGLPTPTKTALAVLVMLWLLGRITAIAGPSTIAPWVDFAFLPVLGFLIALPIFRSHNTRNLKVLFIIAVLACLNAVFHLAYLNKLPSIFSHVAIIAALDVITLLMAVIGGRIIPAFTTNAMPLAKATEKPVQVTWIEVVAIGTLLLVLSGTLLEGWYQIPNIVWFLLLTLAALIHFVRLILWKPVSTLRNPLLLMLPVAYCWIPISLGLRAYAQVFTLSPSISIHALTLGAISSLMLAMMARSALGHTGHALKAGPIEITAFMLIQLAAVVRVVIGFIDAQFYQWGVIISGILWIAGFFIFLIRYYPILIRPRVDGKAV